MAKTIRLRHQRSGIDRDGFFGFSWTTLIFGCFPALFRGDFAVFAAGLVVSLVLGGPTLGFGALIVNVAWAFLYNRHYTLRLLEHGYEFRDSPGLVAEAQAELGAGWGRGPRRGVPRGIAYAVLAALAVVTLGLVAVVVVSAHNMPHHANR
jgi:hypothetical protein